MGKKVTFLILIGASIFLIDQWLKQIFLDGLRWQSEYIDLVLTFNKGVAFSMFAFLGEYLKYIQLLLICVLFFYILSSKELLYHHYIAFGIIIGAGLGNVYDRFIYGGVVDYIFWHKWFNFAVFNFADMMIDFGVFLMLLQMYINHKKSKKTANFS